MPSPKHHHIDKVFIFDNNNDRIKEASDLILNENISSNIHTQKKLALIIPNIESFVKTGLEEGLNILVIMNAVAAFDRNGLKCLIAVEKETKKRTRKLIYSCYHGSKNNKLAKKTGLDPKIFRSVKSTGRTHLEKLSDIIRSYTIPNNL